MKHINKENKTPEDGPIQLLGGSDRTIKEGRANACHNSIQVMLRKDMGD